MKNHSMYFLYTFRDPTPSTFQIPISSVVPQRETSKLPGRKVSKIPKNQGSLGQGGKNAHREF